MNEKQIIQPSCPDEMITAARELYLKHGGRRHELIEKEMRQLGWPFNRQVLYKRSRSGRKEEGWPELYGWKRLLGNSSTAKRTVAPAKREFENWLKETFPEWNWTWRYQRYLYERLG